MTGPRDVVSCTLPPIISSLHPSPHCSPDVHSNDPAIPPYPFAIHPFTNDQALIPPSIKHDPCVHTPNALHIHSKRRSWIHQASIASGPWSWILHAHPSDFPLLSTFRLAARRSCRLKDRLVACMENHVMLTTWTHTPSSPLITHSRTLLAVSNYPALLPLTVACMGALRNSPRSSGCACLLYSIFITTHHTQSSKSSSRDHSLSPTRRNSAPAANCPLASHACMVAWS